jgi:glycosyltransferase involved in cell wall biosynthesis
MSLLSVVTITFNDPEGLASTARTLSSEHVDWIVVDGSTDAKSKEENRKILSTFSVKLLQEPDLGRFDAMNKGLSLAEGEYIVFLNGGDAFVSAETPVNILEFLSRKRVDWVVGQTNAVDKDGFYQWTWPMPKHNSLKLRLGIHSYCHQATVYRRSLLMQVGGFNRESFYSDWQTSLILGRKVRPKISTELWTNFLINGISSNLTIEYWANESMKLRREAKSLIGGTVLTDFIAQKLAAIFISTTRGQLIRPDLVKKYGK